MRAEKEILSDTLRTCSERLTADRQKATDIGDCVLVAQSFSGSIQTGVIQQFEDLLTRAVRQIFGRDYQVRVEFQAKGNSFWADFHMILPNGRRVSLSNGEGGGLKDLSAVLNRILYLVLDPTQPARIVFMDENLSNLDIDRAPYAFELLKRITGQLGIQVVWVSHMEAMASDAASSPEGVTRLRFTNDGTSTAVTEMPTIQGGKPDAEAPTAP